MRVHRLLLVPFLARHARLWLVVRLATSAVLLLAREHPLQLAAWTIVGLVALCAILNVLEMARRHEFDLLGNLGVSRASMACFVLVPPMVGEMALLALRR